MPSCVNRAGWGWLAHSPTYPSPTRGQHWGLTAISALTALTWSGKLGEISLGARQCKSRAEQGRNSDGGRVRDTGISIQCYKSKWLAVVCLCSFKELAENLKRQKGTGSIPRGETK